MAKEYIEREADGFKYYMVRNKTDGQYFRGKGVNKWGKHYNQASIYRIKKNAEETVVELSHRGEEAEVIEIRIIEATADVVEVVRCRDCVFVVKHWGRVLCAKRLYSDDYSVKVLTPTNLDNFCNYGAKMDGKGDA